MATFSPLEIPRLQNQLTCVNYLGLTVMDPMPSGDYYGNSISRDVHLFVGKEHKGPTNRFKNQN